MHDWIFRHRARLRAILGLADPPEPLASDGLTPAPRRPARRLVARRAGAPGRPAPGEVQRSGGSIVLGPMPRRGR